MLSTCFSYVLPSVSAANIGGKKFDETKNEFIAQLALFNQVLADKTFLVGDRFSIADISLALDLLPAYQYVLGDEARTKIVNVGRWFMAVMHQPDVRTVIYSDGFKFISQPSKFDGSEFCKILALKDFL
jgi:elongation factor 1-gamma